MLKHEADLSLLRGQAGDVSRSEARRPPCGARKPAMVSSSMVLPAPGRAEHDEHGSGVDPEVDRTEGGRFPPCRCEPDRGPALGQRPVTVEAPDAPAGGEGAEDQEGGQRDEQEQNGGRGGLGQAGLQEQIVDLDGGGHRVVGDDDDRAELGDGAGVDEDSAGEHAAQRRAGAVTRRKAWPGVAPRLRAARSKGVDRLEGDSGAVDRERDADEQHRGTIPHWVP